MKNILYGLNNIVHFLRRNSSLFSIYIFEEKINNVQVFDMGVPVIVMYECSAE